MQKIPELDNLIRLISKLPGLGPKSAKRIILKLINNQDEIMIPISEQLHEIKKNIERCSKCGTYKSNKLNCYNCESLLKSHNKICIVENIADQWAIESSNIYQGYFHILGGTLPDINSKNKVNLLVDALIEKVKNNKIEEVIIATSATIEGQTTAFYIKDILKPYNLSITKLAQGIPMGGEIETLDDGTLISAFKNRKDLKNI
ncbi:recombination mediator RecR [Candidatus Pelagibacter sp.]|nr:recombination mediator RecR [Candidatus Pelagibacter sp.]